MFVLEYSNPQERTKGYALKRIFEYIDENFGIKNYDGFHVFDADNVLDSQYFNKMNDAFLFYDRKNVITGFRNSKNFGTNAQTATYGLSFIISCCIESTGRMALNSSSRLVGSGFVFSPEMIKDGWNLVDMSDDTDFTAEQIIAGRKVIYCDEAMYYDEHPTTFKAMWRQRLRWAKGALIILKKRFKELFKTMFSLKKQGQKPLRWSSFDLICCNVPVGGIGVFLFIINIILLALSPLFGETDIATIWIGWAVLTAISFAFFYIAMSVMAIICYVKERKRIKGVSIWTKIASTLLWPFFVLMLAPLQIVAMFTRQFTWTQIVHSDSGGHETFNDVSLETAKSEIKNTEGEE